MAPPLGLLPGTFARYRAGDSLPLLMAIMSDTALAGQHGVAMGLRTQADRSASFLAPIAIGALIPATGIVLGFLAGAVFSSSPLTVVLSLHAGTERRSQALRSGHEAAPPMTQET